MDQIPQEQMLKRYYLLPKSVQDALFDEKTAGVLHKTCTLRDMETHVSVMARLTGRVLLGYLRPESFAFEIQKETGVDALKATQVAHDLDTEIFSAVRLELKKLYPPTIQTPTVQRPGFSGQESGMGTGGEKPRPFVVQIPERFKKTSPWPIRQDQNVSPQQAQPTTNNSQLITDLKETVQPAPMPATPVAEQKPAAPPAPPAENLDGQATPQPPIQKAPQPTSPPMDPIVPLPTFIRSKFKQGTLESKKEEVPEASSAQDALKNAFGKFTVPSTATGVTKEPVSPYRETIEEPTKSGEQKPAPKIQGKVIDLSQF